jgi:2-polyprenyl-6-methoxyphenol hydroxylase-like FAD-dependent oxidoreductase
VSDEAPLKVIVAGGSLGGLGAGLAIHTAGLDVEVHERSPGPLATGGAGIVVQAELERLLHEGGAGLLPTTSCRVRRYLDAGGGDGQTQPMPQRFTSWEAIHRTMSAAFPAGRVHAGSPLRALDGGAPVDEHGNGGVRAVVEAADGARHEADVVVWADGGQSTARQRLLPDVAPAYAGYVAWRGTLPEAEAPADLVRFLDDAFTFSEARSGGHVLCYLIPGDGADASPGRRRLNWVWYVRADETVRDRLLVDRDGRHHHASLRAGEASDAAVADLAALARREVHPMLARLVEATPDPFLQVIQDVAVPRMVFGRECLLGDAAFVVRPHTAGATAKAAKDALVLAGTLSRVRRNVDAGLRGYEGLQLDYGQAMVDYGVALGRRFA